LSLALAEFQALEEIYDACGPSREVPPRGKRGLASGRKNGIDQIRGLEHTVWYDGR
jgi:hypothetical protein